MAAKARASALLGTVQLVTAAAVIGIVGVVSDGSVLRMLLLIAGCGAVAFVIGLFTLTRVPQVVPAAAEYNHARGDCAVGHVGFHPANHEMEHQTAAS